MKKIMSLTLLSILIMNFLLLSVFAVIPTISSYVTDTASVFSPDTKIAMENSLRALEMQTNGVQFVVVIENEYDKAYSLEEYTLKIAEQNKIGRAQQDNGVLFYFAAKDRQYRWEVGYGAESTLSASLLGRISRDYMLPKFQEGDFEGGIVSGADAVSRVLLQSQDADILALQQPEPKKFPWSLVIFIIIVLIVLAILISEAKQTIASSAQSDSVYRGAGNGIFMGGFGRGRGGFGGFSGGGGSFGGGGFSGRF